RGAALAVAPAGAGLASRAAGSVNQRMSSPRWRSAALGARPSLLCPSRSGAAAPCSGGPLFLPSIGSSCLRDGPARSCCSAPASEAPAWGGRRPPAGVADRGYGGSRSTDVAHGSILLLRTSRHSISNDPQRPAAG